MEHNINTETSDIQVLEVFEEGKHVTNKKKLYVCNIYRPPVRTAESKTTFISEMTDLFQTLRNQENVIITGDFNINLLKYKEESSTNDFLDLIMSCGYVPKITLPTRLGEKSGTLIDNFFVKISRNLCTAKAGILINNLSDHFPYFICIENFAKPNSSTNYIKIYPNHDLATIKLKEELKTPEILNKLNDICHSKSNINDCYDKFIHILLTLINKYFEVRIVKFNKHKHKKSPWITCGIIKSICYRDKMYAKLKSGRLNDEQYSALKINLKNTIGC